MNKDNATFEEWMAELRRYAKSLRLEFMIGDGSGQVTEEVAASVKLMVTPTLAEDDTALRDIKPQAGLAVPPAWPWIAGALFAAAAAAIGGWWLYRRWRGEPAFRLGGEGPAEWNVPPARPFSSRSTPRLRLGYLSEDARATSIASRLKAGLEQQGLEILLDPLDAAELRRSLDEGDLQLALLAHRPPVGDPVLALKHTFWNVGLFRDAAWELLERAAWWPPGERQTILPVGALLWSLSTRLARAGPMLWMTSKMGISI